MSEEHRQLPESVTEVSVDGKQVYLVGTAHISKKSVEDVKTTVELIKSDSVCVELCEGRLKSILERDSWKKMNIFKVVKEKRSLFLLAQLIMSSFYRKLGEEFGVQPGAEMIEAVKQAHATGSELILADREIETTLKRVWGYLGFWNKMKLFFHLTLSIFDDEKVDEKIVEELKQKDQLENILAEFAGKFPEVKKRLIDERDIFLSQKIRNAPGERIVAVVGAGHTIGIEKHIQKEQSIDELMETPPKSPVGTIIKWAIPAIIVGVFAAGFFKEGAEHSMQSIYIWVLVNGTLSALGAAIALAHPLTIAASFVGAPLTSLNPMIAAGWVAGLVQAWIAKPTVSDLEKLPEAIATVKGFWFNPATKILLVVALANLGSMLGTWIAGTWIAARLF